MDVKHQEQWQFTPAPDASRPLSRFQYPLITKEYRFGRLKLEETPGALKNISFPTINRNFRQNTSHKLLVDVVGVVVVVL